MSQDSQIQSKVPSPIYKPRVALVSENGKWVSKVTYFENKNDPEAVTLVCHDRVELLKQ